MPRRATLGFRYASLDDEMMLPTEQELTHAVESVETSRHEKEKARKLRWWHNHAKRLNKERRAVACSIENRYKAAERRARQRGWGWEFTQEEWERAWMEAPLVIVPGSRTRSNPEGVVVPAYALRGSHALKNTCMQRLDPNKPWSKDNYKIMFRGKELTPNHQFYGGPPSLDEN